MKFRRGQVAVGRTSFSAGHQRDQVAAGRTSFSVLELCPVQDCQEMPRISCHASNLHGQVAAEFMLYIAVFLIVVIAAFIVINSLQSTELPLRENTVALEVGHGFASAFALGVEGGRGFSYNYTFPKTILGAPYNITLPDQNNNIILDWYGPYGDFSYSYKLPSYNYKVKDDNGCIVQKASQQGPYYVIKSDSCSNLLILNNDGETLTVSQGA